MLRRAVCAGASLEGVGLVDEWVEGCCEWSGEILRLRCAQSDTGPWPRGMGPRMREDNGRGEGAHEGRPYGGRVVWWAVGMAHSNGMEWR